MLTQHLFLHTKHPTLQRGLFMSSGAVYTPAASRKKLSPQCGTDGLRGQCTDQLGTQLHASSFSKLFESEDKTGFWDPPDPRRSERISLQRIRLNKQLLQQISAHELLVKHFQNTSAALSMPSEREKVLFHMEVSHFLGQGSHRIDAGFLQQAVLPELRPKESLINGEAREAGPESLWDSQRHAQQEGESSFSPCFQSCSRSSHLRFSQHHCSMS